MFAAERIAYSETHCFSKIVTDYLAGEQKLQPFYSFAPASDGIRQAIEIRSKQSIDRTTLVSVLKDQYKEVDVSKAVTDNIEKLLTDNCFTVCTAHQPNLFTGPLYFIYKIVHAIKLAQHLQTSLAQNFIPVFYMGSEDADLAELDHFTVKGKRYQWKTSAKGAVGRMTADKEIVKLIDELSSQIGVEKNGNDFVSLLRDAFQTGVSIQSSTLKLINTLFGEFGLIVLIADDARLKKKMIPVFRDDLLNHNPGNIVEASCKQLSEHYNVQANPRAVNLFYLRDDLRERIEIKNDEYIVLNSAFRFSKEEILKELEEYPERFSPNVILRGLYQETILPNVAFIGGGGELSYWLQLKSLFDNYNVPFPVLVLRNSFLLIDKQNGQLMNKLHLAVNDLFITEKDMLNRSLEAEGKKPALNGELDEIRSTFENLKKLAAAVDPTLEKHVEALQIKTSNQVLGLEKKMVRAERKKDEARQRQVERLKRELFPGNGLQERVENIGYYYAKFGRGFIEKLIEVSPALEQEFTVLVED